MNTDLLIAVLSLAGLQIGLVAWLRADMRRMEDRLNENARSLREEIGELREEISELREEVGKLRERMAHLEGLLDGLREALTFRSAA